MTISISSGNAQPHWCECDIEVKAPVSLAPDKELPFGRTRVGIVSAAHPISKPVKIYTDHAVVDGDYRIGITAYLYDEDGAISVRKEVAESIISRGIANGKIVQQS
jgi:hypothetical protein